MKYRLGLDVGTNSLGWSVLGLDGKGQPCRIAAAGARIFSEGRDPKSKSTLAATRRDARQARRRRDRFVQRRRFLLAELTEMGLFPADEGERKALQRLNPLELRAKALSEPLSPHEIGRALFHLNQRRGFKSNRKDRSEEVSTGRVSKSYRLLLQEMGLVGEQLAEEDYKSLSKEEKKAARRREAGDRLQALEDLRARQDLTYGAFLWRRQQAGKPTRARPGAGEDGKLYDVYPTRELYEDEFRKIWSAQAEHRPHLLTDSRRDRIHEVIFTQRLLKPQDRGQCAYISGELRTYRAMPSFQRYRIYQEVNSLEWTDAVGRRRCLIDHEARLARDEIVGMLERPTTKDGLVVFGKMKTVLKKHGLAEGEFALNFEGPKRKGFDGDLTALKMQQEDCLGEAWHDWPLAKQDEFIALLMDDKKDDDVRAVMLEEYGLDEITAEHCMGAALADGTAHVSAKAAKLMMEAMRDGIEQDGDTILPLQYQAAGYLAERVDGFKDPMRRPKGAESEFQPLPHLPYYGEAFQDGRHIIPGTRSPEDRHDERKYFGGLTNPTVHIALNQIRHLVNELIDRFGHPDSIAIELARELPAGKEGRGEIEKEQAENQRKNEALDKELQELSPPITANRENRIRLRLWKELSKDPNGRCCPFSGTKIGIADLFTDRVEVEHLIPFSQSLDPSYANKVVSMRKANRDKGRRTPYEAFHDSPGSYDWELIVRRANELPFSKRWRFGENAREIWQREHSDFTARHLNDTRYIGRLAREYLELVCHIDRIDVLTGRLTALLRGHWGLNGILSNKGDGGKSRDDHRHHAVDAIVIGLTSRSMLQRVSTAANRAEDLDADRLFVSAREIDPWENFRSDVRDAVSGIVVSHKPSRKAVAHGATDGQLHNDTAYGAVFGPDKQGRHQVVVRKPVADFKKLADVEAIRDSRIRAGFKSAFEAAERKGEKGVDGIKQFALQHGIRRLRRLDTLSAIPIRDQAGNPYKLHKGDSNWGIEIYELPKGHQKAGEWDGQIISRFDANQPGFKPGQTRRPHPAARLVMRLQINDNIRVEVDGEQRLFRLQTMQKDGRMSFAPLNEANVDARVREKEMSYLSKSAKGLKALKARKAHISPTGRVSLENRLRGRE